MTIEISWKLEQDGNLINAQGKFVKYKFTKIISTNIRVCQRMKMISLFYNYIDKNLTQSK